PRCLRGSCARSGPGAEPGGRGGVSWRLARPRCAPPPRRRRGLRARRRRALFGSGLGGRQMRYSGWEILRNALTHGRRWQPVWRDPTPKPAYDVVIIGGGGHGLATAFYLAKNHAITRVAVLERG